MRDRIAASRPVVWILLEANRFVIAGALLTLIVAVLIVLGTVDPAPLRGAVVTSDPIETLFQGLLTAIITGVTLVVTINQLVLSQEFGAVGDQRERMEGAISFREDVEALLGTPVSPPEPAAFLRGLIEVTGERARSFRDAVDADAGELGDRADRFVDSLTRNADAVSDQLAGAQFGTFAVVFAALNFNYGWKIYEARRLRAEFDEALTTEAAEALDEVIEALELFGPAREHVKTLYFQ